jgi:hypothetical protein
MDLIARIEQALGAESLDPTEFEQCAAVLLQDTYPGLSAVEGGYDFGRDADIYFPIEPGAPKGRMGRLLATTGRDVRANVVSGLESMAKAGLAANVIVVATNRPLSGRRRRTIEQLTAEQGVEETHFYARGWFIGRLAKEPEWRERLLGISGELGALVRVPLSILEQPVVAPELVGRDSELDQLRQLIIAQKDAILLGVPGAGKTRILSELGEGAYFLEPAPDARVIDDLRIHAPNAVIVDDAHDRRSELSLLRRARSQEGLSFTVIAAAWPDQADLVADALPTAQLICLPVLEREPMNELVQLAGVSGYRARGYILEQAEGRPGWALTLTEVLLQGNGDDILSGAALLHQVEGFLRRSTQSATAVDGLACVAALDPFPDDDLPRLAQLVNIPLAEMSNALHGAARNGLLDRTGDGWKLQPALVAPFVARWFFSDQSVRPWSTLRSSFHDRGLRLDEATVHAAEVGATAALEQADRWASSLPDPLEWDGRIWSIVRAYSGLGRDRASWAVDRARAVLASSQRQMVEYPSFGITVDPSGEAARDQLVHAARQYVLPDAVVGLLDLSVGDSRPRPQNPDHPLRVLADLATHVDPDFGVNTEIRRRLLQPALAWLREQATADRWRIIAELLAAIFSIRVVGNWTDPGNPRTVTFTRGLDTPAHLDELIEMWSSTVDAALAGADHPEVVSIPADAMVLLLDLADEWLRLGTARLPEREHVSDEHAHAGALGGERILETLRPHLLRFAGLALRAQRIRDESDRSDLDAFELDRDLIAFVGERPALEFDDYDAYKEQRNARLGQLASRLAELEPDEAVRRFNELLEQASLSNGHADDAWLLAERLGEQMTEPAGWYGCAARRRCRPVLGVALNLLLAQPEWELALDALRDALADDQLRSAVIGSVLSRSDVSPAVSLVLSELGAGDVWLLDTALLRRKEADSVVHRLLTHDVTAIASTTAVAFAIGSKHGPPLPTEWRKEWEASVVSMRAEELDQHTQWRAGELLKHLARAEPDLFERWFHARLDEILQKGFVHAPDPYGSEAFLALLPQPNRERLIRRCAGKPSVGHSLLTHLLTGPDVALATRLLDEGVLSLKDVLSALVGRRGTMLEGLGPVLVHRGVPASDVAATGNFDEFTTGPESAVHQARLEYFQRLLDHDDEDLRAIAAAGVEQQKERLRAALEEEHQDRVRGRL